MRTNSSKNILFAFFLIIAALILWYAHSVFLLAFSGIILAILLNALGRGTKKITHLPYPFALLLALIAILGIFTLIFWLYSPLIYDQFQDLVKQLPEAMNALWSQITSLFGDNIITQIKINKELVSTQKILPQLFSIFSTTLGSIIGFIIFIVLGFYMAFAPAKYVDWVVALFPQNKKKGILDFFETIWRLLNGWLLGKLLSMAMVGICAFIGLWLLNVSLAFILGLLAAILTFIPYVGAILAAIPAILIGFAEDPWKGLYVLILYLVIYAVEAYWITPYIELKTVSIPPAWSILAQLLMLTLIGAIGLALATPLLVVAVAMIHSVRQKHLM